MHTGSDGAYLLRIRRMHIHLLRVGGRAIEEADEEA